MASSLPSASFCSSANCRFWSAVSFKRPSVAGAMSWPGSGKAPGTKPAVRGLPIVSSARQSASWPASLPSLFQRLRVAFSVRGEIQEALEKRRQNAAELRWAAEGRGAAEGKDVLHRIDVFPHDLILGRHFKDRAVGPGTDQRIPVRESLGAGNKRGRSRSSSAQRRSRLACPARMASLGRDRNARGRPRARRSHPRSSSAAAGRRMPLLKISTWPSPGSPWAIQWASCWPNSCWSLTVPAR